MVRIVAVAVVVGGLGCATSKSTFDIEHTRGAPPITRAAPQQPAPRSSRRLHQDNPDDSGTCYLRADQKVVCWGGPDDLFPSVVASTNPQIGITATGTLCTWSATGIVTCPSTDLSTPPFPDLVDLVATLGAFCVLERDGHVDCQGIDDDRLQARQRVAITGVVELVSDETRVCARRDDGSVACWYPLDTRPPLAVKSSPIPLAASHEVVGKPWSCRVHDGVACWRDGGTPTVIPGTRGATEVTAGPSPCAAFADGHVKCWGRQGGQGDGADRFTHTAVAVPGVHDIEQLDASSARVCGLQRTGGVACWPQRVPVVVDDEGDSPADDEDNDPDPVLTPEVIAGIADAREVRVTDDLACVRRAAGSVVCWGTYQRPARNDESIDIDLAVPTPVAALNASTRLFVADDTICGMWQTNRVCLGEPELDPDTVEEWQGAGGWCERGVAGVKCQDRVWNMQQRAAAMTNVTPPSAGGNTQPALDAITDGVDYVLGVPRRWVLRRTGAVIGIDPDAAPLELAARDYVALVRNPTIDSDLVEEVCGLHRGGTVDCWDSAGKLTPVTGLSDAVALAATDEFACARRKTGDVACWGNRRYLGTGNDQVAAPVDVQLATAVE